MKAQPRLIPRFDHVVIVIEENKSYQDIFGSPSYTPYINGLAQQGASFTNAHGEWHPSQPNYLSLFSGLTPEELTALTNVTGDQCIQPGSIQRPNLASELGAQRAQPFPFAGYAENMPPDAASKCYKQKDEDTKYVSKHVPWPNFANVPASVSLDWTMFPKDPKGYSQLPMISFVIPNNQNNMHPASQPGDVKNWSYNLGEADNWLKDNLAGYIEWAKTHNSLFILTWDEDSSPQVCKEKEDIGKDLATRSKLCKSRYSSKVIKLFPDESHQGTTPADNIIPTIFVGAGVKAGEYLDCITHYDILHTLEVMYGLPLMGETKVPTGAIQEACPGRSASEPITNVWGNSGN